MENEKLIRKLQIKPGSRLLFLNAPESFLASLQPLSDGLTLYTIPGGSCDYVHLFAKDSAELNQLAPIALSAVKPGGLLWFPYPKKSAKVPSDLSRDEGRVVISQAGYRPVRQVSLDDTWSAVRFREHEDKKDDDIEGKYQGGYAKYTDL